MQQSKPNKSLHGLNKPVSEIGLFLLVMGYWFFVRQLEQVDFAASTWGWVQGIVALFNILPSPFSNFFIWVAEFFSWRVIRHLIPFAVGWWLARRAILAMVQSFYELEDKDAAGSLVHRLSSGRLGIARPTVVKLDTFEEARKKESLLKIGGPGRIIVMAGSVLVTEKDGRFCRVLGSGKHVLARFEKPRTLLDLRPHERENEKIKMMTSDGIEITVDLTITFQIFRGNELPTRTNPFPYDEEAVRKAAYTETNQPDGSVGYWHGMPMLLMAAQLRRVVSEYTLDELIVSDPNGIDIHRRLQLEMERRAKPILKLYGIWVRGSRLGALQLPDVVETQRKKYWQATWSTEQLRKRAEGDAAVLQSHEIARAEVEAVMLRAIAEGLQRSENIGGKETSRQIVALRLIESLEEMARKSEEVMPMPDQLTLQLERLNQQLRLTSGKIEASEKQD